VTTIQRSSRADSISAWGIGVGIGLIALQLTWLVGARLAGLVWAPPVGPTVAFVTALIVGAIVSVIAGRRLARKVGTDRSRN
jgi:membrane protein implicated in regulation of membrane protease activity